jgi:methyl-accepting chemotaxis protein I, serine sensor receptor
MFSKVKVASGLLCVLAAFCVFQLVTVGLGFWSRTRTHDDPADLSNIALTKVDVVNETTQRLIDARINLSRAGTRMVRGGAEPGDIVQHAREQWMAAEQFFGALMSVQNTGEENSARAAALAERYKKLHDALTDLVQFLDSNNIQAFLDQPTQSLQDAYLSESRNFVQFGAAASHASLDSIDARMAALRIVSIAILLALVAGTFAVYAALRRGVVAPLEEAGRHVDRIAQGYLGQPIAARGRAGPWLRRGRGGKCEG